MQQCRRKHHIGFWTIKKLPVTLYVATALQLLLC